MKKIIFHIFFAVTANLFGQIKFDANFDSGNFKSVSAIDSTTFLVYTNEDIGGRWFYFRMSGVKNKSVEVTVMTPPADFSRAVYSFDDKEYLRFTEAESPQIGTFKKYFEEDTVYVAYFTPYTYKMLQENLNIWNASEFVSLDTLGFTQNLLPIQEMIITDPSFNDDEKVNVWIHARTHPGETPSSWQFQGIVEELLSGDEVINYYLSKIKFHMIPFTNPDGVYFGRSRTNYDYIDVERDWNKIEFETCLEVQALKGRMSDLSNAKPFSVFLNLHSQASSYCTFWIHTAGSTSQYFYRREYQFSNLNVSDNPYFLKGDYSHSDLKSYFPEGWLWNNYGDQVMALTYETPYNNYFRESTEPYTEVTIDNLFEIGRRTVYAIAEYLEISHPRRYIMDNSNAIASGLITNYSSGLEFYGDDFSVLSEGAENTQITFTSDILPAGMYDVAAWWPTSEGNSFETLFEISAGDNYYEDIKTQKANGGQWNYLTTVELSQEGIISINMQSNSTGLVVADAFRLIYSGSVTVINEANTPVAFNLFQNYPNPFNPSTTIRYNISSGISNTGSGEMVSLVVFDILGREIATLVNESQSPGKYEVQFNADRLGISSGTYLYRLQVGDYISTKKMLLVK